MPHPPGRDAQRRTAAVRRLRTAWGRCGARCAALCGDGWLTRGRHELTAQVMRADPHRPALTPAHCALTRLRTDRRAAHDPPAHCCRGGVSAGLHTMRNEHFGIGVVELMAAGVVPIAHDSGGPRADIVVPWPPPPAPAPGPTGLLAASAADYAAALRRVLGAAADPAAVAAMRERGRAAAGRFSDAGFAGGFAAALAAGLPGLRAGLGRRDE